MLDKTLLECLNHPLDGSLSIVTHDGKEAHVANTWNSYVTVTDDDRLLLPVGGMAKTQQNLEIDPVVKLSIANREVQGMYYKGCGFLVVGKANISDSSEEFKVMKKNFPWARATMEIIIDSIKQTL